MDAPRDTAYELVMFDLDGTLVETAPEIGDAVNDTLRGRSLPAVALPEVERWIGHGTRELLVQALARTRGQAVEAVRAGADLAGITAAFDGHYERRCGTRSRLYPHVREVLEALRGRGVALAVVTNKEGRFTRRVLAAHGLELLFGRVVSGDTLPRKKPDPAGVHSCLAAWRVPCSSAIPPSTWRRRATPAWRCGRCPMATTWASPSRPAGRTG